MSSTEKEMRERIERLIKIMKEDRYIEIVVDMDETVEDTMSWEGETKAGDGVR
jgi:hypothetical protein